MDYQKLAHFLETEAARITYGEVVVRIVKHDNQIRYVEKTATRKEQPEGGGRA